MEKLTKLILTDDGKSDLKNNIEMIKTNNVDNRVFDQQLTSRTEKQSNVKLRLPIENLKVPSENSIPIS